MHLLGDTQGRRRQVILTFQLTASARGHEVLPSRLRHLNLV